jgi:aminotransferase
LSRRISRRVQGFTESVIREMTRVVSQHGGVNLAQGMPNFAPPRALVEAAHRALDGDFHQYAITWGAPSLRGAIADKYRRFYGMDVDPERHVTVCCGATETMLSTLLAVLDPGDEIIVFEPFYENYAHPELGRTKIRFCFPKTDDVLADAGERLQKLRTLVG